MVGYQIAPERAAARMSRGGTLLLFIGGRPGAGNTNLALNVCVRFSQRGFSTILVNANSATPTPSTHQNSAAPQTLPAGSAEDSLQAGPYGLRILCDPQNLPALPAARPDDPHALAAALGLLRVFCDLLVVDCGAAVTPLPAALAAQSDRLVLVTTPDAESVIRTYALLKALLSQGAVAEVGAILNCTRSPADADVAFARLSHAAECFLGRSLANLGFVYADHHVPAAIQHRQPVVLAHPHCAATRGIHEVSDRLADWCGRRANGPGRWIRIAGLFL